MNTTKAHDDKIARLTFASVYPLYIKKVETKWTIKIAEILINYRHDLIHKATGWMLREMGKRNEVELCRFLEANISKMPRTMLRYSIEKFPEDVRRAFLRKKTC